MNLFSFVNITLTACCGLLAIAIRLKAENKKQILWSVFNLNVALWAFCLFFVGIAKSPEQAILAWKASLIPNTFIPVFFYHLVCRYCDIKNRIFLVFAYLQACFFSFFIFFTPIFVNKVEYLFGSFYFAKANVYLTIWLCSLLFVTIISFVVMLSFIQRSMGEKRKEAIFLLIGLLVGFVGGFTIALPVYGILIYPFWHFLVFIYVIGITFIILRTSFLGIRIALVQLLPFAIVSSLVVFISSIFLLKLNFFSSTGLALGLTSSLLAYIIFAYAHNRTHFVWALFNVSVAFWGFSAFFIGRCFDPQKALFLWRIALVGVIFISILFYHVCCLLCKVERKKILFFAYFQGLFFLTLNSFGFYISKPFLFQESFYYFKAEFFYATSFIIWIILILLGLYELVRRYLRSVGFLKMQALYLLIGFAVGFLGGVTNFLPAFGIRLYPFGNITIPLYCIIATYAILRYRLLDIRVAFTRLTIFLTVYAIVLGVPVGLCIWGRQWLTGIFGEGWFWVPMVSLLVFATSGPFIYLFFQRKAEERLLEEERNINKLLTQASYGMTAIQNLPALLNSMTSTLYEILQVKSVRIYMLNQAVNQYELKEPRGENHSELLSGEDALVKMLIKRRAPLVYDEFKARAEGASDIETVNGILTRMQEMKSSVVVPFIIDSRLLGFVALGERGGHQGFSGDLLNALGVLGNQAALAVTNCYFLEDEARRMEKAGLEERRVSLDHVTSSMAHEIDNPMAVIQGQIDVLEMELEDPRVSMPEDLRQSIRESMDYISEARQRVSGMIQAIREYSKATTGILKPITIYDVESGYWKLFGHEFKKDANRDVEYVREITEGLPMILGDSIQLEEVFFNLANNALYAVQRSAVKRITLKIFQKDDDWIRMEYADTGSGIDKKIINDIFLAHVTTKGSAEGSGLGLYRVRKVIELHKGRIWAESEGRDKGTKMIIELPVYHGEK